MQTACSPLPSPAEFDRLTANQFESIRDIEADLNAETQCVPVPTFKSRLIQLLPDKRGRRLNWCRAYWQWFSHGDHKWCKTSSPCDLIIACPACAEYQAREQQKKYDPLYGYIPDAGFTRLSFSLDLSNPKSAYDTLMRHLKAYLPKTPMVAKIKPASDRIEVLYCGPTTPASLAKLITLYPAIQYASHDRVQFRDELWNVLSPNLPRDADLVAELDARYLKVRLLRVAGLSQAERKKLSTKEPESIVDNFHESQTQSCHCGEHGKLTKLPPCPRCGKLPTKISRWQVFSHKEPEADQWTDVVLYTIPPKHE